MVEYCFGDVDTQAAAHERMGWLSHSERNIWLLNQRVNEDGVALSFLQVKEADEARFERVIGSRVDTPAKLLKAVALDPMTHLAVRIDAAKSAAPYFDRKMPVALDGGVDEAGKVVPLFDPSKLEGLSSAELRTLRNLIEKGGKV